MSFSVSLTDKAFETTSWATLSCSFWLRKTENHFGMSHGELIRFNQLLDL